MECLRIQVLDILEGRDVAEVDIFVEFGREAPPGFSIVIEGGVYLV